MYGASHPARKNPKIMVANSAPISPSHVFLGEILIKGVRPKKNPKRYAEISLQMTRQTGRINLHRFLHVNLPYQALHNVDDH